MKIKALIGVVAIALTLSGCGNLNKENYEKLKVGMEFSAVTDIMGKPDNCDETLGTKRCIWGDENKYIKVSFIADKAALFSNNGL